MARSFKPFPGITKYQHFRFAKDSPGIVFTRKMCDSPESATNLLKRGVNGTHFSVETLPPLLTPAGLSQYRAKYLFKEIRPFVKAEYRDVLCPSPT